MGVLSPIAANAAELAAIDAVYAGGAAWLGRCRWLPAPFLAAAAAASGVPADSPLRRRRAAANPAVGAAVVALLRSVPGGVMAWSAADLGRTLFVVDPPRPPRRRPWCPPRGGVERGWGGAGAPAAPAAPSAPAAADPANVVTLRSITLHVRAVVVALVMAGTLVDVSAATYGRTGDRSRPLLVALAPSAGGAPLPPPGVRPPTAWLVFSLLAARQGAAGGAGAMVGGGGGGAAG